MAARVLVVDDEPDAVELMTASLEGAGYEVLAAADGMQALHKARAHLPDLILLDLILPDIDGFSICEILRCQPSTTHIPVILLTALAGEMPRLHGFEIGAFDYCVKPVGVRDLVKRVEAALATASARAAHTGTSDPTSPPA
jgi:two-component system alkaline phosphatase synthesis response regulator PhoP